MIRNIIYKFFTLLPIKKNKVIFFGYYGAQYGCSPKYVSQYMVQDKINWDIVWGTFKPEEITDLKVRKVIFASIPFLYELATSKFIITNYRLGLDMNKRKKQVYVQTWHSSLRLKKIEKDAEKYLAQQYIEQAQRDSKKIDYLLSGCEDSTVIFKRSFWYNGEILKIGTPRIDPVIFKDSGQSEKIKRDLGLDNEDKILLYAPTFRKNNDYSCYINDFTPIVEALKDKFGGNWKVLLRLHPHLMNKARDIIINKDVIHVSKYNDIQELLLCTDFLISDYSSLIFDFLFSKKPVLLFLPDLEDYLIKERELYYNVESLPFLKGYSIEDAATKIKLLDQEGYKLQTNLFLDSIGSYEKGNASEQLVNVLKQHIE